MKKTCKWDAECGYSSLLTHRFSEKIVAAWARVTTDKAPISLEYRLKKTWTSIDRSTGQELSGEHWVQCTAFPEIDSDGTVTTVREAELHAAPPPSLLHKSTNLLLTVDIDTRLGIRHLASQVLGENTGAKIGRCT